MSGERWGHVEEADHAPDPHYNGNGLPAWWTCHTCRLPLRLDGTKPPITTPANRAISDEEPAMSAQP